MDALNHFIDCTFYGGQFGGGDHKSPASFSKYALQSVLEIDRATQGRIRGDLDPELVTLIKTCVCDLSEELLKQEKRRGKTSMSAGKISESYAGYDADRKLVQQIIKRYLSSTNLLYRGV